ncbi:hypothetical protein BaRGS_00030561 [Batillaria attramentaria]|uniref:Uncharacterized protein n=1 Tax=Batillaria attramentaria TaxID=370345 RepID=A0ABD0JU93_9CAEN
MLFDHNGVTDVTEPSTNSRMTSPDVQQRQTDVIQLSKTVTVDRCHQMFQKKQTDVSKRPNNSRMTSPNSTSESTFPQHQFIPRSVPLSHISGHTINYNKLNK